MTTTVLTPGDRTKLEQKIAALEERVRVLEGSPAGQSAVDGGAP